MLFGVNFAFKRDFVLETGGFKADLLSRCEDREFFERLAKTHARAVYNPDIVVHHKVPAARLTKTYFRKWHYDSGRAAAGFANDYPGPMIAGIPGYMLKRSLKSAAGCARSTIGLDFQSALLHWWKLVYDFAFMKRRLQDRLR